MMKWLGAIYIICSAFLSLGKGINGLEKTLVLERLSLGFPRGSFDFEGLEHASVKKHFDMDAFVTIGEDNAEFHCRPPADWIPSPPVYQECELERPDPGTRAAADSERRGSNSDGGRRGIVVNLDDSDDIPGRLFFTVKRPFAGRKRWLSYLDEPLKISLRYETSQDAVLNADVVIWESELLFNANDPKGGSYQYSTVKPFIYRMFPEDSAY